MAYTTDRRKMMKLIAGAGIATSTGAFAVTSANPAAMAQAGDTQLVCTANNVQVRAEPGLDTEVVGLLNTDDVVNLIDTPADVDGLVWLNVTGIEPELPSGWAAALFLDTPTDLAGWGVGVRVYVDTDYLNLRAEPGLDSEVLLVLPQYTRAIISTAPVAVDDFVWNGVIFEYPNGSAAGYVAAEYLAEDIQDLNVEATAAATPVEAGASPVAPDLPEPAQVLEPEDVEDDPSIEPAG